MMDQSQCVVKIWQNVSNLNKGNLEKMRLSSVRKGTGINVIWEQAKVEWNKFDHGVLGSCIFIKLKSLDTGQVIIMGPTWFKMYHMHLLICVSMINYQSRYYY